MGIELDSAGKRLEGFLRRYQDELVSMWTERVRSLSPAREISSPAIIDHLPEILNRLAASLSAQTMLQNEGPRAHAVDRLARGFDLGEVVQEYTLLRHCVLDLWERRIGPTMYIDEVRPLHLAIDKAVEESTVCFARARERELKAVDRISEAALGTGDLDEFLRRLLEATKDTSEVIDSAAVFLRCGDSLHRRAAVGVDLESDLVVDMKIGEGFAGSIARDLDPGFECDRANGIRARYGVPLVHAGECIGVAQIGSATACEFSDEDKLLFRAMASRATSVIVQTQLVRELRGAEASLRLAVEATHLGTWDLSLLTGEAHWSPEMKRIFGVDVQLPAGGSVALIHPDDRRGVEAAIERSYEASGDGAFSLEYRIRVGGDGEERWVSSRGRTFFDEAGRAVRMVGTTLDITARKRAEIAAKFLADATAVLASSLDYPKTLDEVCRLAVPGIADWIMISLVERDGSVGTATVVHADSSKAELLQAMLRRYPRDPAADVGVDAVIRSGVPVLVRDLSDEVLSRVAPDEELRAVVRALGMKSYLIVPMVARERLLGALTLASSEAGRRFEDSDLEIAEQLGRRIALAIDNARLYEDAREATRLREQVLAIVSHDLKSPLATIQLAAHMLSTDLPESGDRALRHRVASITRAGKRMDHLISDLLDVAGIQAGRLSTEPRDTEVTKVLDEVLASHEATATQKGISLRRAASAPDAHVLVDPDRLLQVLGNLVGNAIKFCRAGETVVVGDEERGNNVLFWVRDTGPGISAEDLQHLFEPYWSSARHARQGTGLGLYISRGIVEAHGGRIWVESLVGVGSTFFFTLPLANTVAR